MIVEYLRYTIPQDRQAAFVQDYKAASIPLLRSSYAHAFELAQCTDDKTQFILRIEWSSADDHMKGFRNSPEFQEFFGHIKPYLSDINEMRHYVPLARSA
jgi:quinol monooxygenase YgiN